MNEHPLDFDFQEECKNFAAAYMQAATAENQARSALSQADTVNKQAATASKRAAAAYRQSIAADEHAAVVRSTTGRKQAAAADRLACRLRRKAICLWRLAEKFSKKSRAASIHADKLINYVDISFNTVFSGNKARLL